MKRRLAYSFAYGLALLMIAFALGTAGEANGTIDPNAPPAPDWTKSFYEPNVNHYFLYQQGCHTAQNQPETTLNGVVFLDFGVPRRTAAGDWGELRAQFNQGTPWLFPQILSGLKAWSRGFHNCNPTT